MPHDADSVETLVAAADKALYVAKARGRNCSVAASG
jgi:PleD family two-component response regulator